MTTTNAFGAPFLSLLLLLPLIGAVGIAFVPRRYVGLIRGVALVVSLMAFAWSLLLYAEFDWAQPGMQFVNQINWLPALGVQYLVGVDGISLPLVILSTLLTTIAIGASWPIETRVKEYFIAMLLLETGMLGVFVAFDLFLFFLFWEAALIPMYFLIGVWGGPRRVYASVKFILYTMAGSALMFIAILAVGFLYRGTGAPTFNLLELVQRPAPAAWQPLLFLAFALAFAVKVPLFPLHTWLPDAHVEAPTAGSIILAGVLLKMGTYGLIRFNLPLFPQATQQFAWLFAVLAIIGIIYGAWVAFAQRDVKSLVAYSSVSHMGFIVLGIFALNPQGVQGAVMYMVNHGLSTGALFLLVGYIYERRHTRELAAFGGIWKTWPAYAVLMLIAMLSSVGLPGLNGFVGEFLTMLGAFRAQPIWAVFAATGVILSAVYLFWMFQSVFFGPVTQEENKHLPGLSLREVAVALPLIVLMFVLGVYPELVLGPLQTTVATTLAPFGAAATALR